MNPITRLMLAAIATSLIAASNVDAHAPNKGASGNAHVVPHPPTDGASVATWCAMHMARREFDDALTDCNFAVAENLTNAVALSNRGSLFLVVGDAGKALADFEAAVRLKPQDATLYFNRGLANAALGSRDAAISDYTEAIRLKPDLAIAYHNRGYEHEISGRRDQAITDYRHALEIAPKLQPSRQALKRLTGDL